MELKANKFQLREDFGEFLSRKGQQNQIVYSPPAIPIAVAILSYGWPDHLVRDST
jgi:hypothetical protein